MGSDGRVYAFGKSKRGQLGLGRGSVAAAVPEPIPGLEGVLAVSCGWGHALALTGDSLEVLLASTLELYASAYAERG